MTRLFSPTPKEKVNQVGGCVTTKFQFYVRDEEKNTDANFSLHNSMHFHVGEKLYKITQVVEFLLYTCELTLLPLTIWSQRCLLVK